MDVFRLGGAYDVALIFSQDQDLSGVAAEIQFIAKRGVPIPYNERAALLRV